MLEKMRCKAVVIGDKAQNLIVRYVVFVWRSYNPTLSFSTIWLSKCYVYLRIALRSHDVVCKRNNQVCFLLLQVTFSRAKWGSRGQAPLL